MALEDKNIQCVDCGAMFVFSVAEQELFESKGYMNEPKRCLTCRQARKANRDSGEGSGYRPQRQMHAVVCAKCGRDTEVPFEPRQGRPVYCSDCYNEVRTK